MVPFSLVRRSCGRKGSGAAVMLPGRRGRKLRSVWEIPSEE